MAAMNQTESQSNGNCYSFFCQTDKPHTIRIRCCILGHSNFEKNSNTLGTFVIRVTENDKN